MSIWKSMIAKIVDSHVHMDNVREESRLCAIADDAGIAAMALASIHNPATGSGLPQSLYMKARHPHRFFVFAGLNHNARLSYGRLQTPTLAAQVEAFAAMGCDGIKMIEGKPTSRRRMDIPVTDEYYADYWMRVESLGTPIIWHVNDPEEFWDPARIPGWASQRNWGYGPDDVQKEQLYTEVATILARYPKLNIIFAHFYFLSADLPRAARFLDQHPTVAFDLAPGIEMLYNLSRTPEDARTFFIRYADRIIFGTDVSSGLTHAEGVTRAGILYRWLESADTFRVPPTADFLLGPPEDGEIRGMALPRDVLIKIYHDNFTHRVGPSPRVLDIPRAIAECERLASAAAALSGATAATTEAARVAALLANTPHS